MFHGIGKLKGYQLKLHVDPSVNPVVQKMRRVPFSLKDKVTAKVNELHGVGPTKEKVRAIAEASQPQTPSEVRSFLGLVGFSARFIPDFATTADPLRRLARKGEQFMWGEEQENSFQKLKSQVASAPVLAYFDKDAPTRVIADASPVGLGAVLVQEKNGESRAVCYASHSFESSGVSL